MPTLAEILPGQSVNVVQVEGNDSIALRLMEMGILDGDSIQVVGRAPLGDPIEIALRGCRLSLRLSEARRVHVDQPSK